MPRTFAEATTTRTSLNTEISCNNLMGGSGDCISSSIIQLQGIGNSSCKVEKSKLCKVPSNSLQGQLTSTQTSLFVMLFFASPA
jgi:hypothetical protein